jgi:hypothetical protein
MLARLFAELGVESDIPAENRLKACADIAYDRARADDEPARDAEVLGDLITRKLEARRDHRMVDSIFHMIQVYTSGLFSAFCISTGSK